MSTSVVSKRTPWGEGRAVLLRRAGSGGCIVSGLPNENWQRAVQMTNPGKTGHDQQPYTAFRLAIIPETEGYDNMPGCSLIILPGDHEGQGYREGNSVRFPGVPTTDNILGHPFSYGMLHLSTNFEDLQALHSALGEVIASIKETKQVKA